MLLAVVVVVRRVVDIHSEVREAKTWGGSGGEEKRKEDGCFKKLMFPVREPEADVWRVTVDWIRRIVQLGVHKGKMPGISSAGEDKDSAKRNRLVV